MPDQDLTRARWRKSSPSPETGWFKSSLSTQTGDCVEVRVLPDGSRLVRDSKNPSGPVLRFTPGEWAAFLGGVHLGEFD